MSAAKIYSLIDEIINDVNNLCMSSKSFSSQKRNNNPGDLDKKTQHSNTKKKKKKKKKKSKDPIYIPQSIEPYFDTHCHLDTILRESNCNLSDLSTFINSNFKGNYDGCITVGPYTPVTSDKQCNILTMIQPVLDIVNSSNNIYAAFGIHPHYAKQWNDNVKQQIINTIKTKNKNHKIVAVGECGPDYGLYGIKNSPKDTQKKAFIEQIEISKSLNMALVIHSRDAEDDTFDIMQEYCPKNKCIHLHCFSGSLQYAQKMLNEFTNLYIGFTGCITFKSKKLDDTRNVAKIIALERILLESDGPYMPPEPYRWTKISHPGYIEIVAKKIANLKGIDVDKVLKQCRLNTKKVYGI